MGVIFVESYKGFRRSGYCGALRATNIGEEASVCGWVQRRRDLGGLIFVTVRDRSGIIQCTFDEAYRKDLFDKASALRSEYVVAIRGEVRSRGEGAVNKDMPTGEVEILAAELRILSEAEDTAVRDRRRAQRKRRRQAQIPLSGSPPPRDAAKHRNAA